MKFINLLKKELSELINLQMILGLIVSLGIFMALGGIMNVTIDEAVESWNKRYGNGIDIVYCKECVHSYWIQEPCHGKVEYHCKKLESVVDKYFFCGAGVERKVMPNGNQRVP